MSIKHNTDKLIPFVERLSSGEWFYKDGRIWRTGKWMNATTFRKFDEPQVASKPDSRGYYRIYNKNITAYEHTLIYVWHRGIESLKDFDCIDHINNNKGDNRIENLEAVTIAENNRRAEKDGLVNRTYGEVNGQCKLTKHDLTRIRELHEKGLSQYEIADIVGTRQGNVSRILNGKSRKFG